MKGRGQRRMDQARAQGRVRRYYVRVLGLEPRPTWNPRYCSCDLCRASERARAKRRERRAPTVTTEQAAWQDRDDSEQEVNS